jgi:hypothetical protein
MNDQMQNGMAEATRLTQLGRLDEANRRYPAGPRRHVRPGGAGRFRQHRRAD